MEVITSGESQQLALENVDFLSRIDFEVAYNACGADLHAWNPFAEPIDYRARVDKAERWARQVQATLNCHVVELPGHHGFIMIDMNGSLECRIVYFSPKHEGEFVRGLNFPGAVTSVLGA